MDFQKSDFKPGRNYFVTELKNWSDRNSRLNVF